MPVQHETVLLAREELLQRVVGLEGVAEVIVGEATHVVGAQPVTEEKRAGHGLVVARGGERLEEAALFRVERGEGTGQVAELILERPAVVVAPHDIDAGGGEQAAAAGGVARTVDDVADGEDAVEREAGQVIEHALEGLVLRVDVADRGDP